MVMPRSLRMRCTGSAMNPAGATPHEAPLSMLVPAWILIVGVVAFGLDTSFTIGSATAAARFLFGESP